MRGSDPELPIGCTGSPVRRNRRHCSPRGLVRIFILSAGWGLIPATFLTPSYDITFAASAEPWKRRRKADRYEDFNLLPDDGDPVVFVGGKDYLPLSVNLTAPLSLRKVVFFNSSRDPELREGFDAVRYDRHADQLAL